jgi:phosphoglycerate dehydrogenase-like enzyme
MELSPPPLVVAFELSERRKSIVADGLAGASTIIYLAELDGAARAEALRKAGALLTNNTAKDLRSGEAALLHSARLIQFTIAGVDFIPFSELPEGVPVATNGGGYAESMAEHALAMTLAAAKRLIVEHKNLNYAQSHARGRRLRNLRLRRHWRRDWPIDVQHRHAGACHQPTWPDG